MTDDLLYSLTTLTFLYNKEEQIIHLNCMLFFAFVMFFFCLFHKYLLIASFTIAWYVMYAIRKNLIMLYSLMRNLIVAHYSAVYSETHSFPRPLSFLQLTFLVCFHSNKLISLESSPL